MHRFLVPRGTQAAAAQAAPADDCQTLATHEAACNEAANSMGLTWSYNEHRHIGRPSREELSMRQLAARTCVHECVPKGAQLNVPAEWKPGMPMDVDERLKEVAMINVKLADTVHEIHGTRGVGAGPRGSTHASRRCGSP